MLVRVKKLPGRTGQLPTRSPHRPGRAQLRHPVPLVKVSLCAIYTHPFLLSVVVAFTCLSDFCASSGFLCIHLTCFLPTVLLPGAALPLCFHMHRSGFLRSRFPCLWYYDCATTSHCPFRSLRSCYATGTGGVLLFRNAFTSLFHCGASESPVYLLPALSVGGFFPPEAMRPHTFPYDLLYICPALRPRLRWPYSLNARPRSLPLTPK